jgi:hypothetical protein
MSLRIYAEDQLFVVDGEKFPKINNSESNEIFTKFPKRVMEHIVKHSTLGVLNQNLTHFEMAEISALSNILGYQPLCNNIPSYISCLFIFEPSEFSIHCEHMIIDSLLFDFNFDIFDDNIIMIRYGEIIKSLRKFLNLTQLSILKFLMINENHKITVHLKLQKDYLYSIPSVSFRSEIFDSFTSDATQILDLSNRLPILYYPMK